MGTANGWFLRLSTRIHVDQIIICLSQNSPKLERLEVQWDPDTIRNSDNSSKFIDQLRSVPWTLTYRDQCPYPRSPVMDEQRMMTVDEVSALSFFSASKLRCR